jgi:DNA-binding transcriptional LysR family regulator
MRASLSQLEAFYWIARMGSFHAAARHLHVTQPTITARIAELEHILGARVFVRDRQRTALTARGMRMVEAVGRMLSLSDEIAQGTGAHGTLRGLLRLGAVESVALLALPKLLPRLLADYPALKVELTLDVGTTLNRKLNASELDVAVLTDPKVGESVSVEPVGLIELAWFASANLRLPRREIRPADLRDLPILTMPNPSTIYTSMSAWFAAADVEPQRVSTCNSLSLMVQLIVAGQGVAPMPSAMMRTELESGRIRQLATRPTMSAGLLAVACDGPGHRYRPLVRTIVEAVHDSGLTAPLSP